jgi:hypothetical protein
MMIFTGKILGFKWSLPRIPGTLENTQSIPQFSSKKIKQIIPKIDLKISLKQEDFTEKSKDLTKKAISAHQRTLLHNIHCINLW